MKALIRCLAALAFFGAVAAWAADGNPALWKVEARGDFDTVLAGIKRGLESAQFTVTGEENLARGLEKNAQQFPPGQWNSIGFGRVAAVHFCSLQLSREIFNTDMDWAVLCPFRVMAYSMKNTPDRVTIVLVRPGWILGRDPHPRAPEIARQIEDRIIGAIRDELLL